MYGRDGSEMANILKSEPDTKHIPIFFLSGLVTKDDGKCNTKEDVSCLLSSHSQKRN